MLFAGVPETVTGVVKVAADVGRVVAGAVGVAAGFGRAVVGVLAVVASVARESLLQVRRVIAAFVTLICAQ